MGLLSYFSSVSSDSLALRGPALASEPGFRNDQFVAELNNKGCYVHIISSTPGKIEKDLQKIALPEIPTPATLVGLSPARLYSMNQWQHCSGLVFTPSTHSLLSHKHDFWSNRLQGIASKTLTSYSKNSFFSNTEKGKAHQKYAKYLSKKFNGLDSATSSCVLNNPQKFIKIQENIDFRRAKYREMKARANLAFEGSSSITDESSKFVIANVLGNPSNIASWSKKRLLDALAIKISRNPLIENVLGHAIIKIQGFSSGQLKNYLESSICPTSRMKQHNHYANWISVNSTLASNEHLILPELTDIKGVYVNVSAVSGVDQAIQIKSALEVKQRSASIKQYNPAILYLPVNYKGNTLFQAGWSQTIAPWGTTGLIEYANTGLVTAEDGKRFRPKHGKLLAITSPTGTLRSTMDDLSTVRSGGDNLLHCAFKSGQPLEVIQFFYYWKVNLDEANGAGKKPVDLATSVPEPIKAFLKTRIQTPIGIDAERQEFTRKLIRQAG